MLQVTQKDKKKSIYHKVFQYLGWVEVSIFIQHPLFQYWGKIEDHLG